MDTTLRTGGGQRARRRWEGEAWGAQRTRQAQELARRVGAAARRRWRRRARGVLHSSKLPPHLAARLTLSLATAPEVGPLSATLSPVQASGGTEGNEGTEVKMHLWAYARGRGPEGSGWSRPRPPRRLQRRLLGIRHGSGDCLGADHCGPRCCRHCFPWPSQPCAAAAAAAAAAATASASASASAAAPAAHRTPKRRRSLWQQPLRPRRRALLPPHQPRALVRASAHLRAPCSGRW